MGILCVAGFQDALCLFIPSSNGVNLSRRVDDLSRPSSVVTTIVYYHSPYEAIHPTKQFASARDLMIQLIQGNCSILVTEIPD